MGLVSGLATYFIIWWICLFLVLPFGVKSQLESEDSEQRLGTVSSAPAQSMMWRRVVATTLLASLVFSLFYWAVEIKGFGLDDLTFLPMPDSLK